VSTLDDLRKLGEFPAVEEWQKAIKLAEEAGVDGYAVMNHSLCRTAIEELAEALTHIDAKSTQNEVVPGSFSPDSKCDCARGPSGQRGE